MNGAIFMAVFRVERTHNYTVMSNYHLRDKRLSLKAKGLLSQMLSLPEDWDYTLLGLARINAEGKDAIRAAVVELEKAGYVFRRQTTDKVGKFSANEYIIRESPVSQEGASSAQPLSENPTTEEPSTGTTATGNPTQIKKEGQRKENKLPNPQSTEFLPFPSSPPTENAPTQQEEKRRKSGRIQKRELDAYRALIRENIRYEDFVQENPCDAAQLDEMVELMVETVCSPKETIRVAGTDFPRVIVKSRLLKLDEEHIRFVFDCLQENTTQVKNIKQYLLTVLFNAPTTITNHYAARVNHDFAAKPPKEKNIWIPSARVW